MQTQKHTLVQIDTRIPGFVEGLQTEIHRKLVEIF